MKPTPDIDPLTLAPDRFVDSDHPAIVEFARTHALGLPPRQAAVRLAAVVRDLLRYSPWGLSADPDSWTASAAKATIERDVSSEGFATTTFPAAKAGAIARAA